MNDLRNQLTQVWFFNRCQCILPHFGTINILSFVSLVSSDWLFSEYFVYRLPKNVTSESSTSYIADERRESWCKRGCSESFKKRTRIYISSKSLCLYVTTFRRENGRKLCIQSRVFSCQFGLIMISRNCRIDHVTFKVQSQLVFPSARGLLRSIFDERTFNTMNLFSPVPCVILAAIEALHAGRHLMLMINYRAHAISAWEWRYNDIFFVARIHASRVRFQKGAVTSNAWYVRISVTYSCM